MITRSTGFQRVVHHPQPRGTVLEGDKPWERRGVTPLYGGRRKDGRLEFYYRAHGLQGDFACYVVSEGGIHWEKPILGLLDSPSQDDPPGKNNNLVPCQQPRDLLLHGNVRDPSKRFVICRRGRTKKSDVYFGSEPPDFVNDPHALNKFVDSGGFLASNHNTIEFWGDLHDEWVAMRQATCSDCLCQTYSGVPTSPNGAGSIITIYLRVLDVILREPKRLKNDSASDR